MYVGSADSDKHDQVLDSIMVGPVPLGINKFTFQVWVVDIFYFFKGSLDWLFLH